MSQARFLFPLIAAATSLSFSESAAQNAAPEKTYRSTLTYIRGAEYSFYQGAADDQEQMLIHAGTKSAGVIEGNILGDGRTTLSLDTIGKTVRGVSAIDTKLHNFIVFFHGVARTDTTDTELEEYVTKQSLKNRVDNDNDSTSLFAQDVLHVMGENMQSMEEEGDLVRMRYLPCYGMAGLFGMGDLPANAHIWVGSPGDRRNGPHDNATNDCFFAMSRMLWPEAPYNGFGLDNMIDASILAQNYVGNEAYPIKWGKENYVVVVTDRDGAEDTFQGRNFGKHELRVIDLNEKSVEMVQDFSRDEIEKMLREYDDVVPALMDLQQRLVRDMKWDSTMQMNAYPPLLRAQRFGNNVIDQTVASMHEMKTRSDFDALPDVQKRILNRAAYHLYSDPKNWDKCQTAGEYCEENHLWFLGERNFKSFQAGPR